MVRIRRGGVAPLPSSQYVAEDVFEVPAFLDGLERVSGRCWSSESVTQCLQLDGRTLCRTCSLAELGERPELLAARTNAAVPAKRFYANLERDQARPDAEFARMMARSRAAYKT